MLEPVYLQAIAQVQPRAMEHDPEVVHFNAQNLANFFTFKTLNFAQSESADSALRQWRETVVENFPEITALD